MIERVAGGSRRRPAHPCVRCVRLARLSKRNDAPVVAQVSQPAVSPTSKSAGCTTACALGMSNRLRVWKPAIQQTGKSALQTQFRNSDLIGAQLDAVSKSLAAKRPNGNSRGGQPTVGCGRKVRPLRGRRCWRGEPWAVAHGYSRFVPAGQLVTCRAALPFTGWRIWRSPRAPRPSASRA